MDGWMGGRAGLTIAYSNNKLEGSARLNRLTCKVFTTTWIEREVHGSKIGRVRFFSF